MPGYHILRLTSATRAAQVVILETAAARKSTPDILKLHGIPCDRSPDLLPEKPASPTKRGRIAAKDA